MQENVVAVMIKTDVLLFHEEGTLVMFHSAAVKTALKRLGY